MSSLDQMFVLLRYLYLNAVQNRYDDLDLLGIL